MCTFCFCHYVYTSLLWRVLREINSRIFFSLLSLRMSFSFRPADRKGNSLIMQQKGGKNNNDPKIFFFKSTLFFFFFFRPFGLLRRNPRKWRLLYSLFLGVGYSFIPLSFFIFFTAFYASLARSLTLGNCVDETRHGEENGAKSLRSGRRHSSTRREYSHSICINLESRKSEASEKRTEKALNSKQGRHSINRLQLV